MVGLLILSLALAAPAAAANPDSPASQPASSTQPGSTVAEQASARSFDNMELHPASDVCYKIRAYVFSQDATPKFLRETTCGPKVSQTRKTQGYKLILVPEKGESDTAADKK